METAIYPKTIILLDNRNLVDTGDKENTYSDVCEDTFEYEGRQFAKPSVWKLVKKLTLNENITHKTPITVKDLCEAVRVIILDILQLTPAEYDHNWSTVFNRNAGLEYALSKIASGCPAKIRKECLFSQKRIIFAMCFPTYYKEHFPKIIATQILVPDGKMRGDLKHAGSIKKNKVNYGEEVDEIIWNAIHDAWKTLFNCTTEEMFLMLAAPKTFGINFGSFEVIKSRGCYPSVLDFYMWNAPQDFQEDHIEEYLQAREAAKLPYLEELDFLVKSYYRFDRAECQKLFEKYK